MNELGMKIISSEYQVDRFPHFIADGSDIKDPYGIYHVPATAKFIDYGAFDNITNVRGKKIPYEEVLDTIDNSISTYGYAVVVIHPQDFGLIAKGNPTKELDEKNIDDLSRMIDTLISNNRKITTFSNLVGIPPQTLSDIRSPILEPPPDIAMVLNDTESTTTEAKTKIALGEPVVTDLIDPSPQISSDAPADGLFPVGTTTVIWTAKDNSGNAAIAKQYVTLAMSPDSEEPMISITSPETNQQVTKSGSEVTLKIHGMVSDHGGSGIKFVEVRAGANGSFTPLTVATMSPSASDSSLIEWMAPIVVTKRGEISVIAKATDYFGNEKIISIPITVQLGEGDGANRNYSNVSNMTDTKVSLDQIPNTILNGNDVSLTGRLVARDTSIASNDDSKNNSDTSSSSGMGLASQTISFSGTTSVSETITKSDGTFSSPGSVPSSIGPTISELRIQARYAGDGSQYGPSDSPVMTYVCVSLVTLTYCALSGSSG
jgi:KaiC/GvpD/RAD55 family RecA-like ATPase